MPDDVSPERVTAIVMAARVPLPPEAAARIACTVTPPLKRFADAGIAMEMEVEPATFVAVQRKDAGL